MKKWIAEVQTLSNAHHQKKCILLDMYLLLTSIPKDQNNIVWVPDYMRTLVDVLLDIILTSSTHMRVREPALNVLQASCGCYPDVCDIICLDATAEFEALVDMVCKTTDHSLREAFWSLIHCVALISDKCQPRMLPLVDLCVQTIESSDRSDLAEITTFHCIQFLANLSVRPINSTFLSQHPAVMPVIGNILSHSDARALRLAAILACANLGVDISLQQCALVMQGLRDATIPPVKDSLMHYTDLWKLFYSCSILLKNPLKQFFFRDAGLCQVIGKILSDKTASRKIISHALDCLWLLQQE